MTDRRTLSSRSAIVLAALLGGLAPAAAPRPALAQSGDLGEISARLERVQRELQTLQRTVYRGQTPPAAAQGAAPGAVPDSGFATTVEVRLTDLENVLRRLEQRIETLEVGSRRTTERLDRMTADLEVRLRSLEQGRPPPPPGAGASAPVSPPPPGATIIGGTTAPDAPPRPLGTLRVGAAGDGKSDKQPPRDGTIVAKAAPVLPPGDAKQQYDYALSLILNEQDFAAAEKALQAFIEAHPDDELAGNAYFWLGQTHYVRKDFENAAFAFADGFKKFPRGNKAPDNLYKLGMSLSQLGKSREACTAFARLLDNFPDTPATLKSRISREQKRLKCS